MVSKKILIVCNDSTNLKPELSIKALVDQRPEHLEPAQPAVDFGHVPEGKGATATVELANIDDTKSEVVVVDNSDPDLIQTDIAARRLKPGEMTKMEIILSDKTAPGQLNASVTLEAGEKPDSRFTIPVTANITEKIADLNKPNNNVAHKQNEN